MKERPILFTATDVQATLAGSKPQLRLVVKPQPGTNAVRVRELEMIKKWCAYDAKRNKCASLGQCPYGQPGDRLWVRETWALARTLECWNGPAPRMPLPTGWNLHHRASFAQATLNGEPDWWKWRPSTNMPKWASRITLEVTDVRVERLQDITIEDAQSDGVTPTGSPTDSRYWRGAFRDLWDATHAKQGRGWDANPWIWAVSYKRVEGVST